ncbi:MAG: CCA tRNA nucleotidyltransferase [Verrucomicrobiota bacterium]|jgi:poly(A) polymerase|nr:CCA tRNA nucleotidyltransferase [Verrucomicrobiota bacterium]MDD8046399.1 CCA tRNA nucleotidyltransferase [Verrucomicrobiota bacterium]
MNFEWPDSSPARAARDACARIQNAGCQAWIAGGAVRNILIGIPPKDFDIATSATPETLEGLFAKTILVGKQFGTVVLIQDGHAIETTTFRQEGPYPDGRHPAWIRPGSLETDAHRRDFTVNALYFDPIHQRLQDPTNGIQDLQAGVLRAVGDPNQRFLEDHLRILRLVRFSAQLGFSIAPETAEAARQSAHHLPRVSAERIGQELDRAWDTPSPVTALDLLSSLGLLPIILPEVEAMKGVQQPPQFHPEGDVFAHTRGCIAELSNAPADLVWAALLHDVGKPRTFQLDHSETPPRIRFHQHELVGAQMTREILRRLRYSNRRIDRIANLVRDHMKFRNVPEMRPGKLKVLLSRPTIDLALELFRTDCVASARGLDTYHFLMAKRSEMESAPPIAPPFLTGDDLISAGLAPSPLFSRILKEARNLQLDGRLESKPAALQWLQQTIETLHPSPGDP